MDKRGQILSVAEEHDMKNRKDKLLAEERASNNINLKKGDHCPEIFFIGQIVGGQDFSVYQDGLFLEAYLNYGEDWN